MFPPLPWIFKQPLYKRVSSPKFYVNCLRPLSPFVSPRYKANVFYRHFFKLPTALKHLYEFIFFAMLATNPAPLVLIVYT